MSDRHNTYSTKEIMIDIIFEFAATVAANVIGSILGITLYNVSEMRSRKTTEGSVSKEE